MADMKRGEKVMANTGEVIELLRSGALVALDTPDGKARPVVYCTFAELGK